MSPLNNKQDEKLIIYRCWNYNPLNCGDLPWPCCAIALKDEPPRHCLYDGSEVSFKELSEDLEVYLNRIIGREK